MCACVGVSCSCLGSGSSPDVLCGASPDRESGNAPRPAWLNTSLRQTSVMRLIKKENPWRPPAFAWRAWQVVARRPKVGQAAAVGHSHFQRSGWWLWSIHCLCVLFDVDVSLRVACQQRADVFLIPSHGAVSGIVNACLAACFSVACAFCELERSRQRRFPLDVGRPQTRHKGEARALHLR